MKTVEQIKNDQQIKHYFLWYLKSSFLMPRVVKMVMRPGGLEGSEGVQLILNHERSSKALIEELKKHVSEPDLKYVFDEVCHYYVTELGASKIKQLSPELLILNKHHQN